VKNLHTQWIQNILGVTDHVALRVQDEINNYYNLDWSDATHEEIKAVTMHAFSSLNKTIII